jgi:hypothetical protein
LTSLPSGGGIPILEGWKLSPQYILGQKGQIRVLLIATVMMGFGAMVRTASL